MKKVKLFFTALVALLTATVAFAQNVKVTGTVTDSATGDAIPGAAIQLVGSDTNYALSDALGNYSISVPKDGVLAVSCLGFVSQEIPVAGRTVINIALESESQSLEETIVVAYGTTKKSSFTGSATQLGSESIKKMQTTNVGKALEGAVAGLQTASSSGTPGSGASIQIRGFGSVLASTSPLLIVDGVPYEGSLNSIPASDIEAITVLKDAAANSMYGARGSNGVIMITTRSGKVGKVHVSFDAKVGVNSKAIPDYDVVTSNADYYELAWESVRNSVYNAGTLGYAQAGLYASGALVPEFHLYNIYSGIADNAIIDPATGKVNANASALKWNDSWRDVFHRGIRQEYNVSASGGSDKTQGFLSISYLNDDGIVNNSGFSRISVRGKVDHAIGKLIKTGLNISYANTVMNQYNDSEGSNYANLSWISQAMPPIYPLYLHDINTGEQIYRTNGEVLYDWGDTTGRQVASSSNAYGQLQTSLYETTRDNLSSRGYINFNITKDLVLSANVAYDVFNTKDITYVTPVGGDAATVGGRGYQEMDRYTALNANQLLTWSPYFGDHSLNLLLGHEIKTDESYYLYGHMTSFVDENVPDFANAIVYQDLTSATSQYFLEGFFSRAEYNYANKYYLTASLRRDGSSRFSEANRWGNFWAVSGAWNLAGEEFTKNNLPWIDAFKIRASFGTQGNDNIGYTKVFEDLYRIDRVDGAAALVKTFRKAPDVTWEKSDNFNVGFESRFFNRLDLNVEYYVKTTTDMIYSMPLAPSQGAPSAQLVNDMDMQNKGIEFDANLTLIKTRDFLWNVNVNGTHYTNTITRVPSDYPEGGKQVGTWWREEGHPLYEYYLYEWRGVDPQTGLPQYFGGVDDEGKDIIVNTTENAKYIKTGKTPIPDLYGGFGTTLRWRGWDASASFAYQLGGWTFDSNYQSLMNNGDFQTNFHKDMYRRWTPGNTDTDVPRLNFGDKYSNSSSTRFLTKSSYLSLRNVTIGYTLPTDLLQKIGVEGVRVYFTGDNLYYISARKGLDVRKSFSGGAGFTYSALRTLSLGVNVTF